MDSDVQPGRITDANDRWVVPLDPVKLYLLRQFNVIPREPLRAIAMEVDRAWTRTGYWLLATNVFGWFLAGGGMLAYMFFLRRGRLDAVLYAILIVQFVMMFGGFFIGWSVAKSKRFPRLRNALLKYKRCAHCGYDLNGLIPADGVTACPECGCSWRLDDQEVRQFDGAALQQRPPIARSVRVSLLLVALFTLGLVIFSFMARTRARRTALPFTTPPITSTQPAMPPASMPTSPAP